ncbi:cation:proton antiporter [Halanaerobium congolense]|uniref:Cell volume regulation protein A n=1 Tax=Halanaerobium congolense TaxID=54121 RepID=A0A1G6SYI7_9FIRM|nr:sodium:proton antiporter [Halanaerobium congolense]TDS26646.1 cell volume regulation protein A [Halanaerobium congolense]SDD21694.1 Sodium/hydrogen exchanger family protein [Halanaerobium congolense]SDL03332.1 Sodium/hydrogen exchanger family protein [Halanaerobium congolense]SDM84903.1 Sodium/hydrogen exchanger family protein [Halanaerobium congolense]
MDVQVVHEAFFMVSIIFFGGMVGGAIAQKLELPDVVLYLIVGILFGPYGLHILNMATESLIIKLILTLGTLFILYLGGREVKIRVIKKVKITIFLLSTVGILISATIVGLSSYLLLGIPITTALLLGAIISPTDPATLVPIFKQHKINQKVAQTVTSESAFNDAVGSVLFFTLLNVITSGHLSLEHSFIIFLKDTSFGIGIGLLVGVLGTILISRSDYGFLKNFSPIMSMFVAITSYLVSENFGGSGFMASFVAGMVCGNKDYFGIKSDKTKKKVQEDVNETVGLILRMMIFIVLGTMIDFNIIFNHFWIHLLIILLFMFVARPLTIFASALPDTKAKWEWNELYFMCWVRETGVMPAAFTGMLMGMDIPYLRHIVGITFMTIIITLLVQFRLPLLIF